MAVGFGETVALPAVTNAAVWAKLDLPLTLAGRAACIFFKPPILWLTIWTEDGQQLRYRVVPGLARGGFLLSPLVADSVSFGLLASTGGLRDLSRSRLTAARLSADTGSGSTSCYQSPARLELFRLEFAGQDLAAVAGFREMTRLWEAVRRLVWLSADYPPQLVSLPGVGSVLRVAPRSAMQLPLEDHPARLRLSFGVLGTNAVVFRVSALGEGGKWVELWSRQIAGLEEQHAVVELGTAKSSDIILETAPADPAQKGGAACYWREIGEEASDGHR
jgi:hypothetical protein